MKKYVGLGLLLGLLIAWGLAACDGGLATPTAIPPPRPTVTTMQPLATPPVLAGALPQSTPDVLGGKKRRTATPVEDTGLMIADNGFRPQPNGFKFENYGSDYPKSPAELTLDDARKMFGDANVCESISDEGVCTPKRAAKTWLGMINRAMNGGHCEGMAVASLTMFLGQDKPGDYKAGATTAYELKHDAKLGNLIAYYWALQMIEPVQSDWLDSEENPPAVLLDQLIARLNDKGGDQVTIGIMQDGEGGHAITPFAVEDRGNGIYWIHVYDNNWPGEDKYIEVDRKANTWTYALAALNPSEDSKPWSGDADTKSLSLAGLLKRGQPLICPWCKTTSREVPGWRQVWLDGKGQALIADDAGHKLGYDQGTLVNTIPGARLVHLRGGLRVDQSPIYYVPDTGAYNVTLQAGKGSAGDLNQMAVFGGGITAAVEDVALTPGQPDHLSLSADNHTLTYQAGGASTPTLKLALSTATGDYQFDVSGVQLDSGKAVTLQVDEAKGQLAVTSTSSAPLHYTLGVHRTGAQGKESFTQGQISLNAGDTHYVAYAAWQGSDSLQIHLDQGSNGSIDSTVKELPSTP